MKGKRRVSLLAVLVCVFALVLSLGLMTACGDDSASTEKPAATAQWYYGTTAPAESLGTTGDHYLNTESLTSYVKTANGAWELTDLYSGTEVPDNEVGDLGDLYLDTNEGVLYQKGDTRWSIVLTIKGEKGRDGVMWFSGEKDPADVTDALAGDFYLNTTEFTVWQLGADGTWNRLGTIKGDPGEDAVHFYDSEGTPAENAELLADAKDGDLYLGVFKGLDGKGAGSRLYRYNAAKNEWTVLMDTVNSADINVYSLADLNELAANIVTYNGYAGKVIHLKSDIDFTETMSFHRAAPRSAEWTPIGTSETPFRGIFDGEDHTISHFTVKTTDDAKAVGFFGYIKNATVERLHFVGVDVTASGEGNVAGVVAGQAEGEIAFLDVTVEGSCKAQNGAKVGGLVGKLEEGDTETKVTVEGSSFTATADETAPVEGTDPSGFVGDNGTVSEENVTVTDSSVTDAEGTRTEWDESGKTVHCIYTAQQLVDLVQSDADLSNDKILLAADLDFSDVTPSGKAYMIKDCLFEIDGKDGDKVHTISGLKYALFLYVKGGAYLHDFTIDLDVNLTDPASNKLARGAIAENIVGSDTSTEVTVENVLVKGNAINMRAAFFDESGEDGKTGTLNFINCRSEVNMTSTGSGEITKVAAFLNLPDAWDVNFIDCVNTGTLTYNAIIISNAVMGGFVSYAQGNGSNTVTFTRCINAGKVELNYVDYGFSSPDVGGFVGKVQRATNIKFIDCANTASVSCIYTATTISIGGFVGQSTGGSIVFEGKNVNGAYTDSDGNMVADADMGKIVANAAGGDVRAGGFVGYPGSAAITVRGTLVNAGEVEVTQREGSSYKFTAYAGGLFGHTTPAVTFEDDCTYYNLGKVTVTVAVETDSVVYLGGVVGYVSGSTYTLGTSTGYNMGTLSATGAATMCTGSFAGRVYSGAGLSDDTLTGFTDNGSVGKKIGQNA